MIGAFSFPILDQIMGFLQTFGAVLVVLGFVIAFAYKLYFIIELISGMVITAVVTYVVWTITQNPLWTAVAFFLFLAGTIVSAAAASIIAVIDGFLISWLGIASLQFPSQGLNAEMILTSAIMAAISVGVAVALGSLDFGSLRIPLFRSMLNSHRNASFPKIGRIGTHAEDVSVCPSCGFHNKPSASFCTRDGVLLSASKKLPSPRAFHQPKSSMICSSCGSANRPGAAFCRICRASLH